MMEDVTDDKRLRDELRRTNDELRELNAKLETTNEELESTNEEMETTAEELETSNEELRSLNEELETTNDELSERTHQLNIINTYNEAIINNVVETLMVLDKDGKVTAWNPAAAMMWGLEKSETVGKNFFILHLTRGINADDLKQMIKRAYDRLTPIGEKEMKYKATTGKDHTVIVSVIPLEKGNDYLGTLVLCRDVTADIKRYRRTKRDGDL
jgi:two-component system, chemotaxis family, CheB/CheR fusion protein